MKSSVKKWIMKAEADLKTAMHEIDLGAGEAVCESICFHSQQAAEKYLKAFLVEKAEEFGNTHNLEYLLELCKKCDSEFSGCELGNLTDYAVEIRYPDDFFVPSFAESRNAYALALEIKKYVLGKMGANCDE